MVGFFLRAALVALGLWLATEIFSGLSFDTVSTLIAAALLLGVVNAVIRPVIVILTLPFTLVTLGLFLLDHQRRDARARRADAAWISHLEFLHGCRHVHYRQCDVVDRVRPDR